MSTDTKSVERPAYLIEKRGVYYRPNAHGYTGVKKEAGRYTEADARSYSHPNGERGPRDGMSYIHEDDAPEFSPYCCESVKVSVLAAERDAATARVAELEARLSEALALTDAGGGGDILLSRDADKCVLTVDEHLGWPDGLSIRHHDDDEPFVVAHLDLEDSQYGPTLWDYAISVLKARRAFLAKKENGDG